MQGTCLPGCHGYVQGVQKGKVKKLDNDYAPNKTIAISNKDKDNQKSAKRLRSNLPPASTLQVWWRLSKRYWSSSRRINVGSRRKNNTLVKEGHHGRTSGERRSCTVEGASPKKGVGKGPTTNWLDIMFVIQGMFDHGLMVAPSSSFPHLPQGFPTQ